ncbi:MAG TPA: beta-ketoacyl-ACP synthase [Rhizomicrobium sp.]|jgi:3-oxoacyl-[acyl-carrier-protein] synthase-1
MKRAVYIHEYSIACALGENVNAVRRNLLSPAPRAVAGEARVPGGRIVPAGAIAFALDGEGTRSNRLADHCLSSLKPAIAQLIEAVGPKRVGVVVGTSTSGVREAGEVFRTRIADGRWPSDYRFAVQELGDTAAHVAKRTGALGPAYGISTACTSGAKALASAARLIEAGLCDAAIAGGIDALCDLTLAGFASLESLSDTVCNPFSVNRRGINLGEGGALFVLSAQPSAIRLAGWGESADAYHMSAPDPEGKGAEAAMLGALSRAAATAADIGYINLHGTATKLNDAMEARAISRLFGAEVHCSSTKPMTGHMLGAAGACEAAFTLMALEAGRLPAHLWDGEYDPELPPIRLVAAQGETADIRRAMSCSYAFGGNNIALVLEKAA